MTERQRRNVNREFERRNEQAAGIEETQQRFREAEAAERERERKEINEDPGVQALLRGGQEREQQARDAAMLREHEEVERRRAAGREELEAETRRRQNLWLLNGGDQAGFASAWPAMEKEFMDAREAERQKLIQEGGVF